MDSTSTPLYAQMVRLSKHSLVYGLGAIGAQLVAFLLIPVYARYLTLGEYGVLEILTTALAILGVVIPLGVTSGLAMSYYQNEDQGHRKRALSTAWLSVTAVSILIVTLLLFLASHVTSLIFDSELYATHFRLVFATAFFDCGVMVALLVHRVQEKSFNYVVISVTRLVLAVGLAIVFVVGLHRGLLGVMESQAIASGLVYLFVMPGLIKQTGFRLSTTILKDMTLFGLPIVPSNLAGWVMNFADRYFLQFISTENELGLYSMGYRLAMAISPLLITPFSLAWGPFFWAVSKERNARQVYSVTLTYFLLLGLFLVLAISVLSKEILVIMAKPQYQPAHKIMPMVALSYLFLGCFSIVSVGINLERKTAYVALITGVAAVVNVGLCYALIPRYGMTGAALATLVSFAVLPAGSYFISRRYYQVDYEWGRIAKLVTAAAVIYAAGLFAGRFYSMVHSYLMVGAFKLVILFTYPALLYLLRFYRPAEIRKTRELICLTPQFVRQKLHQKRTDPATPEDSGQRDSHDNPHGPDS